MLCQIFKIGFVFGEGRVRRFTYILYVPSFGYKESEIVFTSKVLILDVSPEDKKKPNIINNMPANPASSEETGPSYFLSCFFALTVICIAGYLIFHNKNKVKKILVLKFVSNRNQSNLCCSSVDGTGFGRSEAAQWPSPEAVLLVVSEVPKVGQQFGRSHGTKLEHVIQSGRLLVVTNLPIWNNR